MGSRREEERNEKIIRGLLKLPPNRRCINCNSVGPQYVCTEFWTFICIACSGIHREFTHRVKSISMSKFTSQEVDALQKGGNQRARETFLKDWDPLGQRLPDSSNVDKVRSFIKNVYVDRKYAGGKNSDKPPRDIQSLRNHEDQTRRASSYHSYSQSPPYDYQYEDRRYGKQAAVLTRKPGSDRGIYERNISSFLYSPGRLSDRMYEDRFANEGSVTRVSDYSASSGGDPFRSATQSPNYQDTGFSSPANHSSGYISTDHTQRQTLDSEVYTRRHADGIPLPQRTASLGSVESIGGNFTHPKSVNTDNVVDVVSEPEQLSGINQNTKSNSSSPLPSSAPGSSGELDLFKEPYGPEPVTSSASSIDLFQLQTNSSTQPLDFFQSSQISSVPSTQLYTLSQKSHEVAVPKNEGWATFDIPQPAAASVNNQIVTSAEVTLGVEDSLGKLDLEVSSTTSMRFPSFQSSSAYGLSSTDPWHQGTRKDQTSTGASIPSWNAFEDSIGHCSSGSNQHTTESVPVSDPSLVADFAAFQVSENSQEDLSHREVTDGVLLAPQIASLHLLVTSPSYTSSVAPVTGGTQSHATKHRSTNPFDLPYDSEEPRDLFLEMNSLHSALPKAELPTSFLGGVNDSWFSQNPVTTFIPSAAQGGLGYMAAQAPASQMPNVSAEGSVASLGNPFA